jgi:hypothetical protein
MQIESLELHSRAAEGQVEISTNDEAVTSVGTSALSFCLADSFFSLWPSQLSDYRKDSLLVSFIGNLIPPLIQSHLFSSSFFVNFPNTEIRNPIVIIISIIIITTTNALVLIILIIIIISPEYSLDNVFILNAFRPVGSHGKQPSKSKSKIKRI